MHPGPEDGDRAIEEFGVIVYPDPVGIAGRGFIHRDQHIVHLSVDRNGRVSAPAAQSSVHDLLAEDQFAAADDRAGVENRDQRAAAHMQTVDDGAAPKCDVGALSLGGEPVDRAAGDDRGTARRAVAEQREIGGDSARQHRNGAARNGGSVIQHPVLIPAADDPDRTVIRTRRFRPRDQTGAGGPAADGQSCFPSHFAISFRLSRNKILAAEYRRALSPRFATPSGVFRSQGKI